MLALCFAIDCKESYHRLLPVTRMYYGSGRREPKVENSPYLNYILELRSKVYIILSVRGKGYPAPPGQKEATSQDLQAQCAGPPYRARQGHSLTAVGPEEVSYHITRKMMLPRITDPQQWGSPSSSLDIS